MVFPTKFSDCHYTCTHVVVSKLSYPCKKGVEVSESRKDHMISQQVLTFFLYPGCCPFGKLFDVWIDNWICIKVPKG